MTRERRHINEHYRNYCFNSCCHRRGWNLLLPYKRRRRSSKNLYLGFYRRGTCWAGFGVLAGNFAPNGRDNHIH